MTDEALRSGIELEAVVGRRVMRDPRVVERMTEYAERRRSRRGVRWRYRAWS